MSDAPEGLHYYERVLTDETIDRFYTEYLPTVEWDTSTKRRTYDVYFRYDYRSHHITPIDNELPAWLLDPIIEALVSRGYTAFGAPGIIQVRLNMYPVGSSIGPHVDDLGFGAVIASISLGGTVNVNMTLSGYERYAQTVTDNSMFVLTGESRYDWKHGISTVSEVRISLTFRTVL